MSQSFTLVTLMKVYHSQIKSVHSPSGQQVLLWELTRPARQAVLKLRELLVHAPTPIVSSIWHPCTTMSNFITSVVKCNLHGILTCPLTLNIEVKRLRVEKEIE